MYPHSSWQPFSLFDVADSVDSTTITWQCNNTSSLIHTVQMHILKMTWHINRLAMFFRQWRHLSTPIPVSNSPTHFFFTQEADDVATNNEDMQWQMVDTYNGLQPGEQHKPPPPCFSNIPSRGHIAKGDVANNRQITMVRTHPHMYRSMRRPRWQMTMVICLLISIT